MKVIHILEATHGGTRRHILDLLPRQVAMGLECEIIYSPLRNPGFERDAEALRTHGIRATAVPMTTAPRAGINGTALVALARDLRRGRPDLVHCHSTAAGLLGRLAATIAVPRTPVIYTPNCIAFGIALPRLSQRAARAFETLLAPGTAHYIAVGAREARYLKHTVARRRPVTLIPNGVDLPDFDFVAAPEPNGHALSLPPTTFRVGCFGRLSRQKNQMALIEAWPAIRKQVADARLLFVGSGPDEFALKQAATRLGVEGDVDWTGDLPEARPLYARCQVVVQPSLWEGCPYAVLEAMAARVPVVATRVGGVPDLLGAGRTLANRSPGTIAAALLALHNSPEEAAALGREERRRVETYFNATRMTADTVALYSKFA